MGLLWIFLSVLFFSQSHFTLAQYCRPGYFFIDGMCCPNNCDICADLDCIACKTNFVYSSGTCPAGSCPQAHCIQCGNQGCYKCSPGYTLFSKVCIPECPRGSIMNEEGKCISCSHLYGSNCVDCNRTQCTECSSDFFLNSKSVCSSCSEEYGVTCAKCYASNCLECRAGSWMTKFDDGTYACVQEYCKTYSQKEKGCLACHEGYFYENNLCKKGACSDKDCALCGSRGCFNCYSGYIPVNQTCIVGNCSSLYPNCALCNAVNCTSCHPGFDFEIDSTCSDPAWKQFWKGSIIMLILVLIIGCCCSPCCCEDVECCQCIKEGSANIILSRSQKIKDWYYYKLDMDSVD